MNRHHRHGPPPAATPTPGVATAPTSPVLEVDRVGLRLPRGRRGRVVLDDVSLVVRRGQRLGLVGESGSGKSTLLRVMSALRRPDTGQVRHLGVPVTGPGTDLAALRRNVALVLQDPRSSLDPRMRVGRIITEPLRAPVAARLTAAQTRDRLAEVMEDVGLDPAWADRYPHEFSGGQRQRIAIARALVTRPAVLLADEPVSALDVSVRSQVLNLLTGLVEVRGLTMVFVSHDLAVVRHVCDTVAVMAGGRIVEEGPLARVYAHPAHEVTRSLLAAVPRLPAARPDSSH